MTHMHPFMQAIAQGGWDAFVAAGQEMMFGAVSFICELIMVAMMFLILFGVLFYFTNFNTHGKDMIMKGIIAMIIISCIYMAVLGASGPPDISLWFKPPS